MSGVYIGGNNQSPTKGLVANSTAASFAVADSRPTTTKPAASATRTLIERGVGFDDRVSMCVWLYGGNDNNDVVNVKVLGWNRAETTAGVQQWFSAVICEVQGTLSSALLGNALMPVLATEFFCDTLTLTSGIAVLFNGTADVDIATFICGVSFYELVTIDGSLGAGGNAVNWLYTFG